VVLAGRPQRGLCLRDGGRDRGLEIHYTPKHGSWLNVAECELSILSRQCLDRRIPDVASLKCEVGAWTENRNTAAAPLDWRFTVEDARIKMRRLYPSITA
jgi:hypothetical protein